MDKRAWLLDVGKCTIRQLPSYRCTPGPSHGSLYPTGELPRGALSGLFPTMYANEERDSTKYIAKVQAA